MRPVSSTSTRVAALAPGLDSGPNITFSRQLVNAGIVLPVQKSWPGWIEKLKASFPRIVTDCTVVGDEELL